MSPADHNTEDAADRAYGLSSLSKKTRTSNHLQMSKAAHSPQLL